MPRHPRHAPLSAIVITFLACITLFVMSVSCGRNQRNDTLRASLVAVNAARDGFVAWDRKHQQAIVEASKTREEAETAIAGYRDRRKALEGSFEVAYRALAVAATQSDDPSLKAALAVSGELVDAVGKLIGGH